MSYNTTENLPPGMSQGEFEDIMAQCEFSLKNHCLLFHGSEPGERPKRRFDRHFSKRHDEFFEVWDDPKVQKIAITAHRGWGKTSIFGYAAPSQAIVFQKYPFVVYVGATLEGGAQMQTENLKNELLTNTMVRAVIGDIKDVSEENASGQFSKLMWNTSNGSLVLPRGRGQQVRGLLHGNSRVNLIIVDDLEDKESVGSREAVNETERYFRADLENIVNVFEDDWRIVVIGTILAHDTLLTRLKEDDSFVFMDFPITDDEKTLVSVWPERISTEFIQKKKAELKKARRLDIFAREYLNKPAVAEEAIFKPSYFKYFSEIEGTLGPQGVSCFHINFRNEVDAETFILVDPAKSSDQQACYTAIVGITISFGPGGNRIFVREAIQDHLKPQEIPLRAFEMADRLGTNVIGYEITGLNEFIRQPFQDAMFQRGKVYQLVELKARRGTGIYATKDKGKEGRVAAMVQYYQMGAVYHNSTGCCQELEDQLLDFPLSSDWDLMDAESYFIQMLELGGRVFEEPIGAAADEEDLYEKLEHENERLDRQYAELEREDMDFEGEVEYNYG